MSVLETAIDTWSIYNASLSAGDEPTDLAVTERTYLTALAAQTADASGDGKISIVRIGSHPESKANTLRFRCRGITDTSVCTFVLYSGTLGSENDCELSYLGTLSFTIGTQASIDTGYEMASQVVVTAGDTTVTWASTSADDDRVAEAAIDLQGSDLLVIVPTAVGSDCKLIGKAY